MNPMFDPKELEVAGVIPGRFGMPDTPLYDFPATPCEAVKAMYARKPIWQVSNIETLYFAPRVVPDNVARFLVMEAVGITPDQAGGPDMFGIEWEYVPAVNGSIVRPGKPTLEDANDWKKIIKFPDIETWDWEGCVRDNKGYLDEKRFVNVWHLTGWFERLISFMDFQAAALALIDEEQVDAVKELFDKLSDLYIQIFDKFITLFPQVSCFYIHDDWGSQRETFFSPAVVADVLVPPTKKVTDFLHSKGKFADFHSCGQALKQIPNMIACGWDSWAGQPMNDTQKIYELYGDKIIIGVIPDIDPNWNEEQLRAAAREFVDKFCNYDKPCVMNNRAIPNVYREELYKASRLKLQGK